MAPMSGITRADRAELLFASLMADNALGFCQDVAAYLTARLGITTRVLDLPWLECERRLYRGQADFGVVCGLQYVGAVDRGDEPGIDLLAAPVMRGARYANRPIYFSDVVVLRDHPARLLADLRGAMWAYNEPTSHSGYGVTHYTLATRGEHAGFFGRVVASGSHLRSLSLLVTGEIDASAIDSTVLEQELRLRPYLADQIRVVETLGPSPIPPLVVSRALPANLRADLQTALLTMHVDRAGEAVLDAAAMRRLVPVSDADYEPIRQMARVAERTAPWISTSSASVGSGALIPPEAHPSAGAAVHVQHLASDEVRRV
jgi:phosphonate transport system substrate-binding protein